MTLKIESPDFSDWPPNDYFKGKVHHNMVKVFLRMKVDAEWRRDVHGDSSYYEWLMENFDMQPSLDYCVIASHIESEQLTKWEQCLRDRYDWTVQNH